jgi:enterochelin esterase-like enzyme
VPVLRLRRQIGLLIISWFSASGIVADEGTLGDNQRIFSTQLGYELQYRVYTPASSSDDRQLPSLYVTDGPGYLDQGGFKSVLDEAISKGTINPVLVVFLDSRNPDNLVENRRNAQFMCNRNFAEFFASELIPTISRAHPVSTSRDNRVILGLSFGGLNSACFGLTLSDVFSGIAMQSPANGKHVEVVRQLYEEREKLPLKMFLSVGTINDNFNEIKRFRRTLEDKGYDLTYTKVRRGHDWTNWAPLLDDVLVTFFATSQQSK